MKQILVKYTPLLVILIGIYILYTFALSGTLTLFRENTLLEEKLRKALTADQQISKLQIQADLLQQQVSEYTIDSLKNKEFIFHALAEFCKSSRIQLREFPVEGVADKGTYIIETNKIVAEGQYGDLLKLLHFIEFRQKIGRVSSVSFYTVRDHKKQKDILLLNIHIQTIGATL